MKKFVSGIGEVSMTSEEISLWIEDQNKAKEIKNYIKRKIFKSTFVMRCTEEELQQLLDRLSTENIKFREMYSACDFFLTTDSMYAVLHWTVADELGEERANELLEPEE